MGKLKVGVVGVGRLGSQHARVYSELPTSELVAVADVDGRRARRIAKRYKVTAETDYRELYDVVDAVSIAVPTHLHHEVGKDFLEKGIHILLEKPITSKLEEAEELLTLAKRKDLILQIGHIERFNAAIIELEKVVGEPRFIESHRLSSWDPRGTEVGVVLDLMIHDIDIILHLVNSPIEKIDALGVSVLSKYEDIANTRITFANGAVANVTASRVSEEGMRKLRIFQRDAYISLDYLRQDFSIYRKKGKRILKETLSLKKVEPLRLELEDFISCINKGRKPLVSGEKGKEALEVALEITRKIQERKP